MVGKSVDRVLPSLQTCEATDNSCGELRSTNSCSSKTRPVGHAGGAEVGLRTPGGCGRYDFCILGTHWILTPPLAFLHCVWLLRAHKRSLWRYPPLTPLSPRGRGKSGEGVRDNHEVMPAPAGIQGTVHTLLRSRTVRGWPVKFLGPVLKEREGRQRR